MSRTSRVVLLLITGTFLLSTLAFAGFVVYTTFFDKADDSDQNVSVEGENEDMNQGQLEDFEPLTEPVTELQIIDITEGTGDTVQAGATITAHYTGAVAATGAIFQSSHDGGEPVQFSLDGVIAGWTEGVPGMKVGGKRRLIIPAAKAYGENPPPGSGIPENADLVFDIELISIDS